MENFLLGKTKGKIFTWENQRKNFYLGKPKKKFYLGNQRENFYQGKPKEKFLLGKTNGAKFSRNFTGKRGGYEFHFSIDFLNKNVLKISFGFPV